jgi:hypothetical protein
VNLQERFAAFLTQELWTLRRTLTATTASLHLAEPNTLCLGTDDQTFTTRARNIEQRQQYSLRIDPEHAPMLGIRHCIELQPTT